MAKNVTSVAVEFGVELDKFKNQLKQAGDLSTQAQREAVKMWIKEEKKRTKEAENSAKQRERAEKRALQETENARKQAEAHTASLVAGIPVVGTFVTGMTAMKAAMAAATVQVFGLQVALAPMIAAAAGVVAIVGAFRSTQSAAFDARVEVMGLNQTTGLLPETLGAISLAGGDELLSKLGEAAGEAQKRIADAAQGTGEAKKSFDRLGISVTDAKGDIRATDDVIREYIDAVHDIESPTQQAAEMTAMFGGAGRELNAALGDASLSDWVAMTENFGYDYGPEAMEATKNWQVATGTLQKKLQNLVDQGGIGLTKLADAINEVGMGMTAAGAIFEAAREGDFFGAWDRAKEAVRQYQLMLRLTKKAMEETSGAGEGVVDAPRRSTRRATRQVQTLKEKYEEVQAILDDPNFFKSAEVTIELVPPEGYSSFEGYIQEGIQGTIARTDVSYGIELNVEDVTVTDSLFSPDFVQSTKAASALIEEPIKAIDVLKDRVAGATEHMDEMGPKLINTFATVKSHFKAGAGLIDNVMELVSKNMDAYSHRARRTMRTLFQVQKAISISNIIMSTAQAAVAALMPPPIGLGPVAGVPLAAITAASGVTQIALVAQEQPPSFHTGGMIGSPGPMPDEVGITALSGEGVVSRRGMATLDAINRGEMIGGGSAVIVYGARVFDAVQGDLARMPASAMSRAIRAKTRRRVGHRS